MVKGGWKKPQMRRQSNRPGKVTRDGGGNVTMIRFARYKDNPIAPTAIVSKVGGIFRVNTHLIRVTFYDEVPNSEGEPEAIAQVHLVWKTAQDWLATRDVFPFAMDEFEKGSFDADGGRPQ